MSADLQWFIQRYPMDVSSADMERLQLGTSQFEADRIRTEEILMPDWQAPSKHGFRPGYDAYHFQKQAAELWLRKKGLLLGDDVGLGKTISALYGLAGSRYLPAAVVVQAHLPTQWVNEYIVPFTYMTAHIVDGTKPYSLPAANLYVFKYSNIHGWSDIAGTGFFKAVVYDEIQELRNGLDTSKGKAADVFSNNAELRLGASATPVFNYGSEIWNIYQFIDKDVLGPWEEFVREWCKSGPGGKWLVADPDALGSYLRESQVFLRRLRQGRTINTIPIEVDFDQKIADDAEKLARVLAQKVMTGSFVEAGVAARELDAFARLQTGLAKAKSVAVLAKMYLKQGIPILLAGWHRRVYEIWQEELKEFNPMLYTGSESAKQKDRVKKAFINGESDCILISLRSGAGLDGLQKRCSTVIIGEADWAPAVVTQLVGRVDRPGQEADEITVIYPYVNYGSDPTMMAVNAVKKDQARGINDPGLEMPAVYSDESRFKMLAKQFLKEEA
ncbi:DEAD/DEAH box helicase [Rhizobium azibense]|nr:DEAD/DEAH box helicase [Rhizobium azibense]